ncbi:hypothetical protein SAMN05661080_00714 [Modestobacter sp. DSM 44400]|uniref:hypothetical protein n=1 Tax=Modestobacter sp. DSM 44400 TaxID=1550230 RepID=UPI000897B3C8|nr:hypothetical protein [Modestobacter sp. DSM 44400]SDX65850.1 hypothetical protein SAMN05661080_00714 [Modestobacter sp. DSM 44400]
MPDPRAGVTASTAGPDPLPPGLPQYTPRHAQPEPEPKPDAPSVADLSPSAGPRPRHRAGGSRLPRIGADALWPLAAVVAVALAGARTLGGLPLPDDGALTDPAFRLLRGGTAVSLLSPDGLAAVHTAVYATVTRAFSRHDTLTGAGREMLLVLLVVSALLVWRTSRRLGLGDPAAAAAVLAFGAVPLLVPAHAVSAPAAFAVDWALLACRLALARRSAPATWTVAAIAVLLAVLLAPDALLLLTTGLAGAVLTGRVRPGWPAPLRVGVAAVLAVAAVGVRLLLPR